MVYRSYRELFPYLVDERDEFVDDDWQVLAQIKTVESVTEFPAGWRSATLYRLHTDHERVCLYFGGDEYEGLDGNRPYSFVDGVLFDGDGDRIELFEPLVKHVDLTCSNDVGIDVDEFTNLDDPELKELEEGGGGYLSNDGDDGDGEFMIDGDGDKKTFFR